MEDTEMISFQLISAAGGAKSMLVEAMGLARTGQYEEARAKVAEADDCFLEGHHAHMQLLASQGEGELGAPDLLLVHAEDQMMSVEIIKLMTEEFIRLYEERGVQTNAEE